MTRYVSIQGTIGPFVFIFIVSLCEWLKAHSLNPLLSPITVIIKIKRISWLPDINDAGSQQVGILLYPSKSEHPDDNLADFIEIYGASVVGIKSHENPIELLFYGGHVLHIGGLIPLKEVQCSTFVLIKDPEQSFIENIFLAE